MKLIWAVLLLMTMTLNAKEIRIAVAANVNYAIKPLVTAFNDKYPEIKVSVVLGSSGKLTAQIIHGAPYDLFMSANMKYPDNLYKNKQTLTSPIVYAQGALVILSTTTRAFDEGMHILKNPNIKRIAIGNYKTAPYGVAAVEALKNSKLYMTLKEKFVYGESIAQTLLYTTKITDIGIVAKSSLFSPKMLKFKENIHWIDVPSNLYEPIDQGIVILKHAKGRKEVQYFYEFMLSREAKKVLRSFGYHVDANI